jgi:hypothetical protein
MFDASRASRLRIGLYHPRRSTTRSFNRNERQLFWQQLLRWQLIEQWRILQRDIFE